MKINCGVALLLAMLSLSARVCAEPYLAVQEGYKCNVCHVNPTGGGMRNDFGTLYSKVLLPADKVDDTLDKWNGKLSDNVRIGGDLRAGYSSNSAPHTQSQSNFSLEQVRIYGDVSIIPDRLDLYVDEQIAPNSSQNMEAYVRYGSTSGFYLKGGQFYLPFGWRLQDQTAFVREVSGISMTTPDKGVEIGYEHQSWSAQLDFTNGAANATSGSGHQMTSQVVYVKPIWRLGIATSLTQADGGNRRVGGVFAGLKTGPVVWLAEADVVRDESFPDGGRTLETGLLEGDWHIAKGQNLKLTTEYFDPDRAVKHDAQARYSVVYEFTPLPFIQLRAGFRRYRGIPQNDNENRRIIFLELHGYF